MLYLLCKHKVADFAKWHNVFQSHAEAQRKAGLHLLHVLRDVADTNHVVILFQVENLDKAKAFTEAPDAHKAAQDSGVIGVPEILFLNE
jgi:heme-degrading monooxygenase HmoA